MSRTFEIHKDYYGDDYDLYKKDSVTIEEGLTVIVGCNGMGKTTLIREISEVLEDESDIIVIKYNNLTDGNLNAMERHMLRGDLNFTATAYCSSEGERIMMSLYDVAQACGKAVRSIGDKTKEIWLMLDAVDSGFSIDNIIDLKEDLLDLFLSDMQGTGIPTYVLVTANSYEMASGENCLAAYDLEYRKFSGYDEYRDFILETREIKNHRNDKPKKKRNSNRWTEFKRVK